MSEIHDNRLVKIPPTIYEKHEEALAEIAKLKALLEEADKILERQNNEALIDEDEIAKLKQLLDLAKCPQCNMDRAYYDDHGRVYQCQWCSETDAILGRR